MSKQTWDWSNKQLICKNIHLQQFIKIQKPCSLHFPPLSREMSSWAVNMYSNRQSLNTFGKYKRITTFAMSQKHQHEKKSLRQQKIWLARKKKQTKQKTLCHKFIISKFIKYKKYGMYNTNCTISKKHIHNSANN